MNGYEDKEATEARRKAGLLVVALTVVVGTETRTRSHHSV